MERTLSSRVKPPRLYLEPARVKAGKVTHPAVWVVTYRDDKRRTGCGPEDLEGSSRALAEFVAELHQKARREVAQVKNRPASQVSIADVLARYAELKTDVSKDAIFKPVARPDELLGRIDRLLDWWGERTLADIDLDACHAFVRHRGSKSAAGRELDDLRAAVGLALAEGVCRERVVVSMPDKPESRVDWFTRDQVAAMVFHCLTHRVEQRIPRGPRKGELVKTRHRNRRHIVPYILTAVYTGSRSSRIWRASFEREPGRPWIDLEDGVLYRMWRGEMETTKRAGSIRLPENLLRYMRMWQRGSLVDGVRVARRYLVEWNGKASDPSQALREVMVDVFGVDHPFVAHSFRHTAVTWLCWARVPISEIADYVSMTEAMVRKVYKHAHPDTHRDAGEAFSSGRAGRKRGTHRDDRAEASRRVAENSRGKHGNSRSLDRVEEPAE